MQLDGRSALVIGGASSWPVVAVPTDAGPVTVDEGWTADATVVELVDG